MNEDIFNKKIYKNANPSSIIDYVGGKNIHNTIRNSIMQVNPKIMSYKRNIQNIFPKKTIDSKGTSNIIYNLKPVIERYVKDEESSSLSSKDSKTNISIKSHKNIIEHYKNVKTINHRFIKNNIGDRLYASSNRIFNYNENKINERNKYLLNKSVTNDINLVKYSPFQNDNFSNIDIRSITNLSDEEKGEFDLNKYPESDGERRINIKKKTKKAKHKDFQEKVKEIKIKFYVMISLIYFSLHLLCLKISLNLSMPKAPALGVSSFIICFNNLLISVLFMKLDQISFNQFLKFKIGNFFLKIVINYLRILLTIKSLQHLNLFSFILIINMTPLIISYISIRENNLSFKVSDSVCYVLFLFICLSELIVHNKVSMFCTFSLMILNTFSYLTKINVIKSVHSYIVEFGSSLIGISISPLIMSVNKDFLNISFSQYILFVIICFTYFLYHYFESKFTRSSLGQGYQIWTNSLIVILYIIYCNFLLRENIHLNSYIFLGLSFIINIHAKLRNDFNEI